MDYMEKRLYKLFCTMPVKGIFGNYGEFPRYRLLEKLAGWPSNNIRPLIKIIRDKKTVILYPAVYGNDIYVLQDGHALMLKDAMELENMEESEQILIPAKEIKGNYLVEFPAICEDVYATAFRGGFIQGVFFEGFPYDKKSFEELLIHIISNSPCRMAIKIILIQNEVQYGATDVTSGEIAITKAVENMKKYTTEKVLVCAEKEINSGLLEFHIDIQKQHILKKRRIIQKAMEDLKRDFEMEFQEAKERFLMQEIKETPGILSSMGFAKAAEYQNVKREGVNIEAAVFRIYMKQVILEKEYLKEFLDNLWNRFLYEIALLSEKEKDLWIQQWIAVLEREYQPKTFTSCPNSSIEYRKRIEENKIVIQIGNYVNNFVEYMLKREIYNRMKEEIEKCEEKYL